MHFQSNDDGRKGTVDNFKMRLNDEGQKALSADNCRRLGLKRRKAIG